MSEIKIKINFQFFSLLQNDNFDFLSKDQQDDAVIIIGSVEDWLVDSVILGITNAGWEEIAGDLAEDVEPSCQEPRVYRMLIKWGGIYKRKKFYETNPTYQFKKKNQFSIFNFSLLQNDRFEYMVEINCYLHAKLLYLYSFPITFWFM